jgi:hypothetical protein
MIVPAPSIAERLREAVPHWIEKMQARGGPSEADMRNATFFGEGMLQAGYPSVGPDNSKAAMRFNHLAHAIAVAAFDAGGFWCAGTHYLAG